MRRYGFRLGSDLKGFFFVFVIYSRLTVYACHYLT